MTDLFLAAARSKFRFPSSKGQLTVEQLFDLPLTSAAGASLNATAVAINSDLKAQAEESFVETTTNPLKTELAIKLEIVKAVIAIKQAENKAAAEKRERAEKKAKILAAIEAAENRELSQAGVADLRKQLADLDA